MLKENQPVYIFKFRALDRNRLIEDSLLLASQSLYILGGRRILNLW